MVMKTQFKVFTRLFKKHFSRFLTIIAIVIVSVGFMSGAGKVEDQFNSAINTVYVEKNVSDLIIKSKSNFGFKKNDISYFEDKFGKENITKLMCYDLEDEDTKDITRIFSYSFNDSNINKLELIEGNFPSNSNEIVAEEKTHYIEGYSIGEKVEIMGKEYTVSGIVRNPLLIYTEEEPSFVDQDKYITHAIYVDSKPIIATDIYVTLTDRTLFNSYSENYEEYIDNLKNEIKTELGEDKVEVLTLYENVGLYSLFKYGEKIGLIAAVFVLFFLLVTLLVVYSTMTRLLDEERGQIACLKTLGFSNFKITNKYVLFVFTATIIGGLLASGVGLLLTQAIYFAMNANFKMPKFILSNNHTYFLIVLAIIVLSTSILTLLTGLKNINKKPVDLLAPKIARSGKKVLIERIPFIWNKLSFKYKSTCRNVFLFRSRLLMTVISIMGSYVLVIAGFAVLDNCIDLPDAKSIFAIAIAIVCFSAALSLLVIYNLTNINISERNREIATLMVLGYHDDEVSGYIFREIYIMSFIGVICGIPVGVAFVDFILKYIDFGTLDEVNWWSWIIAPLITMLFSFLSTLLLRSKITNTNMDESLKIRE